VNVRDLYVGADGRPRPPWRLLQFVLLSVGCLVVVWFTLGPLIAPLQTRLDIPGLTETYCICLAFLLAHWMTFRTFDKRGWSFVWLDRHAARPRALLGGAALGAAPIGLPSLLLVAVGLLAFRLTPDGPSLLVAAQTVVLLAPAALYEELLSRGYIFATLREWLGARFAVIVTSVAFGLLHLANPNVSPLSIALVILAGVYLAGVVLATKSLYAAWVAHFAWNWTMAALLHVPVSGVSLGMPDYRIVDAGPDWITGGQWGPEGGAAAGLGMLAGLGFLYWRFRARGLQAFPAQSAAENLTGAEGAAENHPE
jgi:uncharacterized protein